MKWIVRVLGALVVLVVLCVVVLFALSRRPGAGSAQQTVEIARPPAVVWAWLTEPEKLTQWVGWLVAVESDTTTPPGVGHREVWVMNDPSMNKPMRIPAVVTAEDPPRSGAARIEMPGAFVGDVGYTLVDLGDGTTRLTQSTKFRYTNALFSLMEPLLSPEAKKKQVADFARLKAKIEATP